VKPIIYIAGPIRDSDFLQAITNLHAFFAMEIELTRLGYSALNPASDVLAAIMHGRFKHGTLLGKDEAFVKRSDAILFLPRWETSNGARQERVWAEEADVPCYTSLDDLKQALPPESH